MLPHVGFGLGAPCGTSRITLIFNTFHARLVLVSSQRLGLDLLVRRCARPSMKPWCLKMTFFSTVPSSFMTSWEARLLNA